jgi:hypothetical protein
MNRNPAQTQTVLESQFQVQSVLPVATPAGSEGDWYRYVITQGNGGDNAITGTRSGNLSDIHRQLADMVERLNERLGKIESKKKYR